MRGCLVGRTTQLNSLQFNFRFEKKSLFVSSEIVKSFRVGCNPFLSSKFREALICFVTRFICLFFVCTPFCHELTARGFNLNVPSLSVSREKSEDEQDLRRSHRLPSLKEPKFCRSGRYRVYFFLGLIII